MEPTRRVPPRSLLAALLLVACCPAWAAVHTTIGSGYWDDAATWSDGLVPGPADEVVIATGHWVAFRSVFDSDDECARLMIAPGAGLVFDGAATDFHVGGNGEGSPGGILVAGTLEITAGVTIHIDPDGNSAAEEDGLVVRPGGRLRLWGGGLHEGAVDSLLVDDGSEIAFEDDSLPAELDLTGARLVWRSGERKGRWYEILSRSGPALTLDAASRSNSERLGQPDQEAGQATVSGTMVTGNGTAWTDAVALGSLWWCESDGIDAAVRVRRVDGPGALQLAVPYAGAGCVQPGGYVLRDRNEPYPARDVSETVLPGDAYSIIRPATVRSRFGSDDALDEQIFVRVQDGASYDLEKASFESVGNEAWASGEGGGVRIEGFDGTTDPDGRFDTVEIYRFAGDAGLEWEDSTGFDVDWLFVHWAHPQITTLNEGHGVKFEHNVPGFTFEDVRLRHARFDRTNDDFVWWSTSVGGTTGVYDSIGKYCPNTAIGRSCDAVDTADELGASGGRIRIERNFFANLGSVDGSSCLDVAVGETGPRPAWRGAGWVARDNVCLNIQEGECLRARGGSLAWDSESIWAVNNVCASIHSNGVRSIPRLYQNQVLDYGLRRVSGADGLRNIYVARGNVVRGVPREAGDTFSGNAVSVGRSLGFEANWWATTWTLADNVIVPSVTGVRVRSWSDAAGPAVGQARVSHNVIAGNPGNDAGVRTFGVLDDHDSPVNDHVTVSDNIFRDLTRNASQAGWGLNQASQDLIDSNVLDEVNSPGWIGNLQAILDQPLATGIDASASDFELDPGSPAWGALTTDGDLPGPRFAGTLLDRLPASVDGVVPRVDPLDQAVDTDADALIDRWDNCSASPNPGWADHDGDGLGDACDPDDDDDGIADVPDNCPFATNDTQDDVDADGLGDACDACPEDALNDADGDGVCGNLDNCPLTASADQADDDEDALGNACDCAPLDSSNVPGQEVGDSLTVKQSGGITLLTVAEGTGPFRLYRGWLKPGAAWSYNHRCLADPMEPMPGSDTRDPLPMTLFYYLVSRYGCPESPAGRNGEGDPIPTRHPCPGGDTDTDADGVEEARDTCPGLFNPSQSDPDRDSHGELCDNCPLAYNPGQVDSDADGVGDACETAPSSPAGG